jgi:hypothetical protein
MPAHQEEEEEEGDRRQEQRWGLAPLYSLLIFSTCALTGPCCWCSSAPLTGWFDVVMVDVASPVSSPITMLSRSFLGYAYL